MWSIIVFSVATVLTLYLGWRLISPAPLSRTKKVLIWFAVALLLFGQRYLHAWRAQGGEGAFYNLGNWVGYTFLGLVSLLVVLMLVRDLPLGLSRFMGGMQKVFVRRSRRPYFIEPNLKRRQFMLNASNAVFLGMAVPLSGYAMFEARRTPSVVRNEFSVVDLPAGLDGFTIAQISDTHVGPTIGEEWTRRVVDEVNGLGADMIVHTGDMVDGSVPTLRQAVSPFADLDAPHGVWFCLGNHEYYSGVEAWIEEVQRLGMTPLLDENMIVDTGRGRILMAGVTDPRGKGMFPSHVSSPIKAMADAEAHDVSVLLAHQPVSVYEASQAGFDIQLSGHTHGGQYFPYTLIVHLFQPYVRGWHMHDGTQLYVNVGTGYWGPPMRLGTEPEITLHTLRRA